MKKLAGIFMICAAALAAGCVPDEPLNQTEQDGALEEAMSQMGRELPLFYNGWELGGLDRWRDEDGDCVASFRLRGKFAAAVTVEFVDNKSEGVALRHVFPYRCEDQLAVRKYLEENEFYVGESPLLGSVQRFYSGPDSIEVTTATDLQTYRRDKIEDDIREILEFNPRRTKAIRFELNPEL